MLKELSTVEKAFEYSKYYYKPAAAAPRETLEKIERGPINPEDALLPAQVNELVKPGYLKEEIGYCFLPDGTGYVAMKTFMKNVTPEMLDWWFAWHGLADLRYKIWCPEKHFSAHVRGNGAQRRIDETIPLKERTWGTTDDVCEDVGQGPDDIHISFMSPFEYGYDPALFKEPDISSAYCINCSHGPNDSPLNTFTHTVRRVVGGVEYRSRFWFGLEFKDGRFQRVKGLEIPLEALIGCCYHNAEEYANLADFLPSLFEEMGGKVTL